MTYDLYGRSSCLLYMILYIIFIVKCDAKPNEYLRTYLYYFIYIMIKMPLIFKINKS